MTIFLKRRNKTYYVVIRENGRERAFSAGTSNKQDAEAIKAKILVEMKEGRWFDKPKGEYLTVRELLAKYIEEYSKLNKRSWRTDEYLARKIGPEFENVRIADLTPGRLDLYVNGRRKDGVTDTTIRLELQLLKHALRLALERWDLVKDTPFRRFALPRPNPGRIRAFSGQEVERVLSQLSERMKRIVTFALNTGLRLTNIASLKWAQVDFVNRVITIPAEEHKNKKAHTLPMNSTVFSLLQAVKTERDNRNVVSLASAVNVFLSGMGEPYTSAGISDNFRRALERAGIEDATFHDLRHTFCTELAARGGTPQDIMFAAGHSDLRSTMRYTHRRMDRLRQVVGLLD